MIINERFESNIIPLKPHGTNSTMFTECCGTAICDNEKGCPKCGGPVVGDDTESGHKRHRIRWANATRFWKRRNI